MVERLMTLGIPIASLAGAGWLLRHDPPKAALAVERDNDVGPWIGRGWAVRGRRGPGRRHDVRGRSTWN